MTVRELMEAVADVPETAVICMRIGNWSKGEPEDEVGVGSVSYDVDENTLTLVEDLS